MIPNPRRPSLPVPVWARTLLTIAPLGDRRGDVESDLAELFGDRIERYGRLYAHRRLCSDIFSLWRGSLRGGTMLQDLRFALRLFRKHPAPVGIAVGGLALAIGVVTSVFSVVNASMLRPYGMDDPSSVVRVHRPFGPTMSPEWAYARFLQMRDQATLVAVEATLADKVRFGAAAADDGGSSRPILFVSGGYLRMLGGRPALGRALEPGDDRAGAPPVVVVSHRLWSTELNSDPSCIGRTVWLNGTPVTLVGVLQPAFTGPVAIQPALWASFATFDDVLPLAESYLVDGRIPESMMGRPFDATSRTLVEVIARLAPGAAPQAAQDNLTAIVNRPLVPGATPAAGAKPLVVQLFSAASPIDGPDAAESYLSIASIVGIVSLVLVVACANTANLLLAAASTRMREIGVRLALGATTRRLFRQMVSESLMLGLAAGGVGYLFAMWFAPILSAMVDVAPGIDSAPDGRVLFFAIVVAVGSGLGAGISPARYGARGNVLSALQAQGGSGGGGAMPSRFRTLFIGFQAAVSMLLLVGAALLVRTAVLMTRGDVGFDADRMVTVSLAIPAKGFDEEGYIQRALAAVREVPSVERAALTQYKPFGNVIETVRLTDADSSYRLYANRSDADFFSTAGVRVLSGRPFTAEEAAREAPVALISESIARAFFAGSNPLGQPLTNLPTRDQQEPATIIGVAADAMLSRLHTQSYGTIYRPIRRRATSPARSQSPPTVIVRAENPALAARAVEDALLRLDSRVRPTATVVRSAVDAYLDSTRTLAWLAGPIAVLALLLAALGVYGVTTFVVHQRTPEVSVRLALGASAADVMRLLVKESLRPVVIGLIVGLAAALAVSRVFASMLPGISPHDPLAIGGAGTTLLAGALVAVIVPARRAARTDPARVLRQV